MTDLLLRFVDRDSAVTFGSSFGVTELIDGVPETPVYADGLALHVIGIHYDPEGVAVPGWWVLVCADTDFPIPDESLAAIGCEIVTEISPEVPSVRFL